MATRNEAPPAYTTEDPSPAGAAGSSQHPTSHPQTGRAARGGRGSPNAPYTFEETLHTTRHTRFASVAPMPRRAPVQTKFPDYRTASGPPRASLPHWQTAHIPERRPLLPDPEHPYVYPGQNRRERRLLVMVVLLQIAVLCGITYTVFIMSGGSISFGRSPPPVPQWTIPTPGKCVKYGRRTYEAHLMNPGVEGLQACQNTSMVFKGVTLPHPDACYYKDGVVGQWNITFGEVKCSPGWGEFYDQGCGLISSRLWGLLHDEDWMLLCQTTPATINGQYFARPAYCRNDIWNGMRGFWRIDDSLCKGIVGGEDQIPADSLLASEDVDNRWASE